MRCTAQPVMRGDMKIKVKGNRKINGWMKLRVKCG